MLEGEQNIHIAYSLVLNYGLVVCGLPPFPLGNADFDFLMTWNCSGMICLHVKDILPSHNSFKISMPNSTKRRWEK
jgi:hypothetical protein